MNGKISAKQINSHLQEVENEEQLIQLRIASLNKELQQKKKIKNKLQSKANRIKARQPQVSEHCVIRWMERVRKDDVEAVKQSILHPKVLELLEKLGDNGTYPHPDGYSIVFKNKTAVTVL